MPVFSIKAGDTKPWMSATLQDAHRRPIDLTGASIEFHMRPKVVGSDGELTADAEIVDELKGSVQYQWADGDTDVPGPYDAEFKITFPDGSVESVPNDSYIEVLILPLLT